MCDDTTSIVDQACKTITDTWSQGNSDLYVPFHAFHLHYAYSDEKIDSLNENTWGLGYGRSLYDNSGNWDGVYGMVFSDSNKEPQPIVGYARQWILGNKDGLHTGLGYTAFLTARARMMHYTPFPGVLPIASINYGKAALNATFVPGGDNNGNIIFLWGRFGF